VSDTAKLEQKIRELEAFAIEHVSQAIAAQGALYRLVYYQEVIRPHKPEQYAQYIDEVWAQAKEALEYCSLANSVERQARYREKKKP
jgi:hypothetical protein